MDILFLSGSYESQRIACLDKCDINLYEEIKKHFIYSCLLAEQVIQPIGHYFQSDIIRRVTKEYAELFTCNELNDGRPIARYAINMFKENFKEDADEKVKTFLGQKEFQCYHDDDYRKKLTEEAENFTPYRRQGKQLDALVSTTLRECTPNGSLYKRIKSRLSDNKKVQIALSPLIRAVQLKEYAILPEYIDLLDEDKTLKKYMTLTRIILMDAYAESCAQLYDTAYINNPIKRFYPIFFEQNYKYELNYLDTNIFDIFLSMFPLVRQAILGVDAKKLMGLKQSTNFISFKKFYIEFVNRIKEKVLCFDIKTSFVEEYSTQYRKYKSDVAYVMEDHPNILYNALRESVERKQIISTSIYLDYANFPIVGFISEVMERVIGAYEKYLFEFYKAKRTNELKEHCVDIKKDLGNKKIMESESEKIKIGIITALPKECAAVKRVMKNVKECKAEGRGAGDTFYIGELDSNYGGIHNVALSLCGMGTNRASIRATRMLNYFPGIEYIIMVGIAAGVPFHDNIEKHVRLGDIVVSEGVVQYDFVKETSEKVICRSDSAKPSAKLLAAVDRIKIKEYEGTYRWKAYIDTYAMDIFVKPESEDVLYDSEGKKVAHPKDDRRDEYPKIFYGRIASANTLLKSQEKREKLKRDMGVLAVEMEASGIADAAWEEETGYLVIRGICDYGDDFKNDDWQEYASIVAACYARDVIENLPTIS